MKKTMFLAALMGVALCGTAMGATTYSDGVTYSGNIYNVEATTSGTFHDRKFTNYYQNTEGAWTKSQSFLGTGASYYVGGNTEATATTGGQAFWNFAFGKGAALYQTLRLSGATTDVTFETQFDPFTLGGLIVEESDSTYMIGRNGDNKGCGVVIKAESGQQANMSIKADTRISAGALNNQNAIAINSSGTWDIAQGKTLSLTRINGSGTEVNVPGGVSLGNGVQLNVKGGGTLSIHSATLSIGAGSAFDIAEGTTVAFSGTANVAASAADIVPGTETKLTEGNGFGTAQYSHVVYTGEGTLSGDVTWQFNGTSQGVSYDAATRTLTGSGNSLTYYINDAATAWNEGAAKVVDVNVGSNTLSLAANKSLNVETLRIESGRVETLRSNATGVATGDIIVDGGATLAVTGAGQDAFGYSGAWGGNYTDSISLNGTDADHKATLELSQTTTNSVTMSTNLNLNGFAQVTTPDSAKRGFNTFGGKITATNTDNEIAATMVLRQAVEVDVVKDGELLISGAVEASAENGTDYSMTKTGAGTLTISGNINGTAAHKVTINGDGANTIVTSGSVSHATLNDVTLNGSSYSMTNVTLGGSTEVTADVTETGTLSVAAGGVTQMTGTLTADSLALSGTLDLAQTALTASTITLNSGATIELANHAGQLTSSSLTVNGDSTINANLVIGADGVMTFTDGVVTLGCTVEFGEGTTVALGTAYYDELAANGKVLLFTGVDAVNGLINGLENVTVTGDFLPGKLIAEQQTDGSFNIYATPEPATATLSLLALAGLMARRRRH